MCQLMANALRARFNDPAPANNDVVLPLLSGATGP